jgi:hypothetical protein
LTRKLSVKVWEANTKFSQVSNLSKFVRGKTFQIKEKRENSYSRYIIWSKSKPLWPTSGVFLFVLFYINVYKYRKEV